MNYDREKLTQAFRNLRKQGFVARQNYECCMGCGLAKIQQEYNLEEKQGYVFYHNQDKRHLVEDGETHLCYGHINSEKTKEVGKKIVEILENSGLKTEWNEDTSRRIKVIATK